MKRTRADVVGREHELRAIQDFLEGDREGASALLLEGEAGIGKTRLWQAGVEHARSLGHTVLVCTAAEGEAALPFVALGDLLTGALDEALPELADVQRTALEVALLRRSAQEAPTDRLASSHAVLAILQRLVRSAPTTLAIDDVQWLDPSTARVCEFVFRRLTEPRFRILLARRTTSDEPPPLGLRSDHLQRLRAGPLSLDELGQLLVHTLALHLPRPRLVELHRASDGNPYFALEIGRSSLERGADEDGLLTVPASIGDLLRDRLAGLSDAARDAALLCAASTQSSTGLVERAADGAEGLEEALHEHVLELDGARLRFSHPLLASVAYTSVTPWARRDAHRRLAEAAADPDERARHLALSVEAPDAAVADELEQAAAHAAARGAPESASYLMERAAELTLPGQETERRRRCAESAQHHLAAGDPDRARAMLEGLVAVTPPGPGRANLLWQLADLGEQFEMSIQLCEQALEEAAGDPGLGAQIQIMLATLTWVVGDLARSVEHSQAAARLAEESGDDLLIAISLADSCQRLMLLARPYEQADIERALELEKRLDGFPAFQRPSYQLALILTYTDHPDRARPLFRAELERLERAGNASWQTSVLMRLADLELRAGDWAEAARFARRGLTNATHAGVAQEQEIALMIHGLIQAHLGHLDEACQAARRALELADQLGDRTYAIRANAVLGFAELSRGDATAALRYLSPATGELRRIGVGELSISQVVQNEIEALVAVGRLEEAEDTIAFVEEKGRPTKRAWHQAVAARGKALVASARGDLDRARTDLDLALAAHERLPQPFELGRTLLAQGQIERRAKKRAVAREVLTKALEIFDQLGAALWAERTAAELARISGRRAAGELTETERRVADLVAEGLSNKEVAARLFVSVRAVEANLSKVYAKLGIRSRTQLASRLDSRAD